MRSTLPLVAACGFSHGALEPVTTTLVDDTAADFAAGTRGELAVDSLGHLAPEAYAPGGLHGRGYVGNHVVPTTSWNDLTDTVLGPMTGERYSDVPGDWAGERPYGIGIGRSDGFTVLYDGEIYLAAGRRTLELVADDFGFFEIELGPIRPAIHAAYNDATRPRIAFDVAAAGWYAIRGAISDSTSGATLILSEVVGGVSQPIGADRLRARVTTAPGVTVVASADRIFTSPVAGAGLELGLIDRDFGGAPPRYDFAPPLSGVNYSLRYAGQLRIDEPGPITFELDVGPDGNDFARLLVDGAAVAGRWPGQIDQLASNPVELAQGWHDVVLDYAQSANTSRIRLATSTPTRAAAPIGPERLRPVRAGGLLTSQILAPQPFALVDASASGAGVRTIDLQLRAPEGATVQFLDAFFWLHNHPRDELSVGVSHAALVEQIAMPQAPPYEGLYEFFPGRAEHAGHAVADGPWQLVLTDTVVSGSAGYIDYPAIIATYRGGPNAPFAREMSYVSAAREAFGTITGVRAIGELAGAALAIEVRTGTATTLDAAPWQPVDAGVVSEGLVQYRLAITSDGWQYPTIDRVELEVTR